MTAVLGLDPLDPQWWSPAADDGRERRAGHAGRGAARPAAGGPGRARTSPRRTPSRDRLTAAGVAVEDTPDGRTTWTLEVTQDDTAWPAIPAPRARCARTARRRGTVVGSGGQRRRGARRRGPTPPADERTGPPGAAGGPTAAAKAAAKGGDRGPRRPGSAPASDEHPRSSLGRNPVVEALRAGVPAPRCTSRWARRRRAGRRGRAARGGHGHLGPRGRRATSSTGSPAARCTRASRCRCPPYEYAHPDDLMDGAPPTRRAAADRRAGRRDRPAQPRRDRALGGGVRRARRGRSRSGVGGHDGRGVADSAGTAARLPVARATNLTRTLEAYANAGLMIAGLDADGTCRLDEFDLAADPLVWSSARRARACPGWCARPATSRCRSRWPGRVESLNASVAAGVVLAEVARRRRAR